MEMLQIAILAGIVFAFVLFAVTLFWATEETAKLSRQTEKSPDGSRAANEHREAA